MYLSTQKFEADRPWKSVSVVDLRRNINLEDIYQKEFAVS